MVQRLIDDILAMNTERSAEFKRGIMERRSYRACHPSEIAVTICMDGRLNFFNLTGSRFGLVTTFRNIGGIHDVGWPMFHHTLNDWESFAHAKRRPAVLIITYHWSASRTEFGCKGFDFDCDRAKQRMLALRSQIEACYGERIFPIVMGIETDSDALIVHGTSGATLDMRFCAAEADESMMRNRLGEVLSLPNQVREDLIPLLVGNAKRVMEVRASHRIPAELEHGERILGIGQGFDWLNHHNLMVAVGLCDPALHQPIVTATRIIQDNWRAGRIGEGGILLVSTPFRDGRDKKPAIAQSCYLAHYAADHIRQAVPEMADFFTPLVGVINRDDRLFEVCA